MTRYIGLVPLFLLVACGGSKDDADGTDVTGDDDDDDDDDDDGCTNSVLTRFPSDGVNDAFYRTDVIATLRNADPAATLTVDGVDGSSMVDGPIVAFVPTAAMSPSTQYTATLNYECGTETWTFTTSATGAPADEAGLVDSTFSLDLSSGTWVQPAGVGDIIGGLITDVEVLFGVTAVNADSIPMIGAVGTGNGTQDICYPTLDFPVDPSWENPYFQVAAPLLEITVADFTIGLEDMRLSGAFSADGSRIEGGVLQGKIDTRPLGAAFDLGDEPEAVCNLVSSFGVTCDPCPDGQPFCLTAWVTDISAAKVSGTITQQDEADPSCN